MKQSHSGIENFCMWDDKKNPLKMMYEIRCCCKYKKLVMVFCKGP